MTARFRALLFDVLAIPFVTVVALAQPKALGPIADFKLVTATAGWVAVGNNLLWTDTAGAAWSNITPPEAKERAIQATYFLNATTGWLLLSPPPTAPSISVEHSGQLHFLKTVNTGQSWSSTVLQLDADDLARYAGVGHVFFADDLHGWVMLRVVSSSNFKLGILLATSDGGITWNKLPPPPIGEPVYFATPTDGWLAGGPNGDALFVTRNGGQSWAKQQLPIPSSLEQPSSLTYTLPRFTSSSDGFVRAAFSYAEREIAVLYQSHDRGATWGLIQSYESEPDTQGWLLRKSTLVADTLILLPRSKPSGLALITRSGVRYRPSGRTGDTPKGEITRVDFADETTGWLLFSDGNCAGFKTGCSQQSSLVITRDGAQTFLDVTPLERSNPDRPSALPQEEGLPKPYTGPLREHDGTSQGYFSSNGTREATSVSQNPGFDKCAADSVANMQTWWASSPYYDTGIYLGGSNRGCAQPNLTANWITQVGGMGWKFMPIWVGPQAPCVTSCSTCGTMSSTVATAASQGTAEADSAANAATALGLASPTIVYYDMESYNATTSCSAAVSAFVNAWVQRTKQRGNLAGVYGSPTNAANDWVSIANPPDAVWIAKWDNRATTLGLTPLPDNLWANNQRIHQYVGGHNETYGTATFNIDNDIENGPVAVVAGSPPPAFTLTNLAPVCDLNPPAAPAVQLNWTASSGATSYDLYRNGAAYSTGLTGTAFYNNANVVAGQTYSYFVRARNASGTTDSNTISVPIPSNICAVSPPPAPILLSPSNGSTGVSLTPTLSWNASSGATSYNVFFGNAAAVNTTGTSYSPGTLVSGTTYFWSVLAINSGGSNSSATWSFTTVQPPPDTQGPNLTISSPSSGSTVTSSTITVSGTASDSGLGNSGISSVTVNGASASGGSASGANTANWSAQVTLNVGSNTITVVAKDGSSNLNPTQQQITITYNPNDTQGPNLTISSPSSGSTVATNTVTVSGTASDSGLGNNGISSVSVNGAAASGGSASGANTANWSAQVTLSLGQNTITVVARDNSSNLNSTQQQITVIYTQPDTQGPSLTISSPNSGSTVTTPTVTVSGTASDSGLGNNGVSSVSVNGAAASGGSASGANTANWSAQVTLSLGQNTITVVARDNSSNLNSTQQQITVIYTPNDTQGPNLTISSPSSGSTVTSSTITVSGTASDSGLGNNGISSVTVNGASASGGSASGANTANWSAQVTLNPGPNTITVIAKDGSPNLNPTQQQITITYTPNDTLAPNLTISSPSPGSTVATSTVTVSGTASDSGLGNNGISSVTVNGASASGGSASGANAANWSSQVALNLGSNTITVVAKDGSPNQNSTTQQITVTRMQVTADGTLNASSVPAAPGGTFSIPLSLTLNAPKTADSITFGVQIVPNGNAPALTGSLGFTSAIPDSPLVNTGGTSNAIAVVWSSISSPVSGTKQLGNITGTLPSGSASGNTYTIQVTGAGASQGNTVYTITPGPAATITVVQNTYKVGDVAPFTSDIAPNFGDGNSNILDLIQVLFAVNNVPGFRPAACSDRFDAMDLYPVDSTSVRGGDGLLDIRDLIRELFRVNNLDPDRPVRPSRGGVCASAASLPAASASLINRQPGSIFQFRDGADGALAFGDPERPGNGEERIPVYLEARHDLARIAITFALGDQWSHLRFVPTPQNTLSLAQNSQVGVVALAWVEGVSLRAGDRLMLGYVIRPEGSLIDLTIYGLSAVGLDDNREVRLDASSAAGMNR